MRTSLLFSPASATSVGIVGRLLIDQLNDHTALLSQQNNGTIVCDPFQGELASADVYFLRSRLSISFRAQTVT
jgi:hypothetical protein